MSNRKNKKKYVDLIGQEALLHFNPIEVAKIEFKNIKKLAYCFIDKAKWHARLFIILYEPCECVSNNKIVPSFFWLNE